MVRVIDASLAIKWFVVEQGHERAFEVLREAISSPGDFAVPELFFFELTHVFNRLLPKATEKQLGLLCQVTTLGIHRFSMTPQLVREIRVFQALGLSGYDGAYVALAKILGGKWVTFDQRAHALVAHLKLSEAL